jgi:dienelactone hydrolase
MALEFARCSEGGEGSVRIALDGGETATSRRLRFDVKESAFRQGGVELVGRLLLPPGEGPVPIAVLVHGSERDSALDGEEWQFLLPARGVGAFVYDKRGTGRSGGVYTQDFDVLAADAVAAAGEARRLAGGRLAELGFFGGSQGGWIAPLAALRGGADFVVAAYGLAESPLAEDREEVLLGLREAGFDDEATRAKALEVVAATARIRASDFRDGFEELEAVKAQYRGEPWLAKVEGEFSGDLLRYPGWVLRLVGPRFDVGTSWEYEPLPTLEAIAVPHLWVLAGDDHDAPSAPTLAILRALQARRPNLDVALFPLADHGMLVPRRDAAGTVVAWSYAEGYQALILAWIQTKSLAGAAAGVQTWEGGAAG